MSEKKTICLPVGIDLGARNTGVFIAPFVACESPAFDLDHCVAATIVMPPDDKMTYSQTNRTAVRHRLRGNRRFDLARRLLELVTREQLRKRSIEASELEMKRLREATGGLLRRRGYSRLESETDLSVLVDADPSLFAENETLGKYFQSSARPLDLQWEDLTEDLLRVKAFRDESDSRTFKSDLTAEKRDKDAIKTALAALKALKEDADSLLSQELMGHKHRSEYLKAIREDILRGDSRLLPLVRAFDGEEALFRLIGNVSNLQLRALRWYFNSVDMASGDRWDPKRLQSVLVRAFRYFHPDEAAKQRIRSVITELEGSSDIVATLCSMDPERTIPPYEDQNNRRPPEDQTLYLCPGKLTERFGDRWTVWSDRLEHASPGIAEGLDEILARPDRKSRLKSAGSAQLPLRAYRCAYVLQRAFDRSKLHDPFALRALAAKRLHGIEQERRLDGLAGVLGSQHVDEFLECARLYYADAADARVGLWMPETSRVVEKSGIHPPMKKHVLKILVANVLQVSEDLSDAFINDVWSGVKVKGRSTVRSSCMAIESFRKAVGGDFNRLLQEARLHQSQGKKPTAEEKKLLAIDARTRETASVIARTLGLSDAQMAKFANPYSLAQLYTLIETEPDGFTSVTLAAHRETAWRMERTTTTGADGESLSAARASRLPADAARPFDGVIRRLIDRTSWEIAKIVADVVRGQSGLRDGVIRIPILVEENRFEFSESLAELKKNSLKRKKMNEAAYLQRTRWLDKNKRIKAASCEICPYTGKSIGSKGEIDHIIPRSFSKERYGTVFNGEANLIYVSLEGNQLKKDEFWPLERLDARYLQKVFNLSGHDAVKRHVEETVERLARDNRLRFFDLLSEDEQACVRHALFLSEGSPVRRAVQDALFNQRKTRVNGTQLWLVRNIVGKLVADLDPWLRKTNNRLEFSAGAVTPDVSQDFRSRLGEIDACMAKPDVQPVASHSIDALCVIAGGLVDLGIRCESLEDSEELRKLYPQECRIIQVARKPLDEKTNFSGAPIFKEAIYSESQLPIFTRGGKVFVGFPAREPEPDASCSFVPVSGKKPEELLTVLEPYLDRPLGELSENRLYRIDRSKASELLSSVASREATAEEIRAAKFIDALSYFTRRASVIGRIFDSAKKRLLPEDEVLKSAAFDVKVALTADKAVKIGGMVTLPAKDEWTKLYRAIVERLGEGADENMLRKILADLWRRPSKRSEQHVPVRRDPSLPVLDKVSGGFRIRRHHRDGSLLWQVHVINKAKGMGFASENGVVDWGKFALFPTLCKKGVAGVGERWAPPSEVTSLREWRRVLDGDVSVWLTPATAGRIHIRIEAPFELAKSWIAAGTGTEPLASPFLLPAALKISNGKAFSDAMPATVQACTGSPRNFLYFNRIGSRIAFRYEVTSNNADMKDAYNRAAAARSK